MLLFKIESRDNKANYINLDQVFNIHLEVHEKEEFPYEMRFMSTGSRDTTISFRSEEDRQEYLDLLEKKAPFISIEDNDDTPDVTDPEYDPMSNLK